MYIQLVCHDF